MAGFKLTSPLSVPMVLLVPTYSNVYGVKEKNFPEMKDGISFFGSFRTFGGTERNINDVYSVEKTAVIDTWYRPDIKADCRIGIPTTNEVYEILGAPENIEMRNQYLRIRVRAVEGGA